MPDGTDGWHWPLQYKEASYDSTTTRLVRHRGNHLSYLRSKRRAPVNEQCTDDQLYRRELTCESEDDQEDNDELEPDCQPLKPV